MITALVLIKAEKGIIPKIASQLGEMEEVMEVLSVTGEYVRYESDNSFKPAQGNHIGLPLRPESPKKICFSSEQDIPPGGIIVLLDTK